MISIIDSNQCKIFCQNCNRTIKEGTNNLKVSQPFCYHLVHGKQGTIMIDDNSEYLNKVAEHFHEEDGHTYKVLKCTERTK